jgi:AsmA protein
MGRILKLLLVFLAAIVVLAIAAVFVFSLVFDPNDYRDRIAQEVEAATGRDFRIDGELGLSLFPWLAVDVGHTELGNAEGFGPEPFATFDSAALSVKLLPLLLHRDIEIGKARLEGLDLKLAIDAAGTSNWQDLLDRQAATDDAAADEDTAPTALDISSVEIVNANLTYADAQAGTRYRIDALNAATGAIRAGEPIPVNASFAFAMDPDDISGVVEFEGRLEQSDAAFALSDLKLTGSVNGETPATATLTTPAVAMDLERGTVEIRDLGIEGQLKGEIPVDFTLAGPAIQLDTNASTAAPGTLSFTAFDLAGTASVEPFSYAGDLAPEASLHVDAFSPRSLMQALDIEMPPTADPNALTRLIVDAHASVGTRTITLDSLRMTLDDTTFTGDLVVPKEASGRFELSLAADKINADRYMAPADETNAAADAAEEPPLEIPVDLIRSINATGALTFGEVVLGGMSFTDVELGLNSTDGKLRINPFTAAFFDGRYEGDITVDATGDVATLSTNEKISDVSLAPLAKTVFDEDNITGLVNGTFRLSGRGNDMSEIQKTLNGSLSFSLADGAYEGVDIWYQLRRARALYRKETPPEPKLPPRTPFSDVSATGKVTDGVMQNDDFRADLPFMRLTGKGKVNFVSGEIDYALSGDVFDRPEGVAGASSGEIADLAKVVIPLKVTGTLVEPKIGIDLEDAAKARVKDELRDRLLDKLGGDRDETTGDGTEQEEKDPEDLLKDELKDKLKGLFDK